MSNDNWAPTARLRFVERGIDIVQGPVTDAGPTSSIVPRRILQQWFAPDLPRYMSSGEGEWRDVPLEMGEP